MGQPCRNGNCVLNGYHFVPDGGGRATDPDVGRKIDKYLIVRALGEGGFGKVLVALELGDRVEVAFKLLKRDPDPKSHAERMRLFDNERRALARLQHPNIVQVKGSGWWSRNGDSDAGDGNADDGEAYLTMELIDGARTLTQELKLWAADGGVIEYAHVETILNGVLAGLEAAHQKGIVHRDIKPDNIMLQAVIGHGVFPRILDFGLAKFVDEATQTKVVMGTVAYMAPEQIRNENIGPWTDLYALGVVAHELMTGRRPFSGTAIEIVGIKLAGQRDPLAAISDLQLPESLKAFLRRALAYAPADRFQDSPSFRKAMTAALAAATAAADGPLTVDISDLVEVDEPVVSRAPSPRPVSKRPAVEPPREPPPEPPRVERRATALVTDKARDSEAIVAPKRRWPWVIAALAIAGVAGVVAVSLSGKPAPSPPVVASAESPHAAPAPSPAPSPPVVEPDTYRPPEPDTYRPPEPDTYRPPEPDTYRPPEPDTRVPAELPAATTIPQVPAGYVRIAGPARVELGSDDGLYSNESRTTVTVERPFYIKQTEVTQGEWRAVMGSNPSTFKACGDECPVETISWVDAVMFTNALSTREGLTSCYAGCAVDDCKQPTFRGFDCDGYRLPTEAEWELAARAGTTTMVWTGDLTISGERNARELDDIAWYGGNSAAQYAGAFNCSEWQETRLPLTRCGPQPVKTKDPNPWRLYDMLGNVWEWTHDGYSRDRDPTKRDDMTTERRTMKGGSWFGTARTMRAAFRDGWPRTERNQRFGLRPVRTAH